MKILCVLLITFALTGCACKKPPTVSIPVYVPPIYTIPEKPVLESDGLGTDGEIARKLSNDLLHMSDYSLKIQNILKAIQVVPKAVDTDSLKIISDK